MNCRIIYKDNKIDHVQAENGERSILFDSLKDIFGAEKALELYALTEEDGYKQKIQEKVRSFVGVTEKQIDKLSEVIDAQEILNKLVETGLANNVYQLSTEEINNKLKELGVSDDVRKRVIAYHGSPYSFDRFTTEKMGTGEGAQAFGWGLYFTDLQSIAKNYAEVLVDSALNNYIEEFDNKLNTKYENFYDIVNNLSEGKFLNESWRKEADKLIKEEIEFYKSEYKDVGISNKEAKENLKLLNELILDINNIPNKNLYKVSLHKGKTPSEYTWLEWDKEVSKTQLEKISENVLDKTLAINTTGIFQFRKNEKFYRGEKTNNQWKFIDRNTGESVEYSEVSNAWQELYNQEVLNKKEFKFYKRLEDFLESDKNASLFLLESGIDGIKYPAESISRGATSDTARGFNYVVFDENAITIEEQIQFQKSGITPITNGFIYKNDVYLNKNADDSVLLHEFNHLYNNWLKQNRPEVYKKGLDLVKAELKKKNSEIQDIIDFVKTNQPNLEGEKLNEEILTEMVGRRGLELLIEQKDKAKSSGIIDYLKTVWQEIKNMLGLSSYTDEQVLNMNLQDFANASAVDLLRGERLGTFSEESNDIRYQIIGEKGASKIEEYSSKLNSAKELEKQGESIDEIANKTGWYKQNNQWKYLAPELLEQLKLTDNYDTNTIYKLQDILQDKDTLLQMYPEMGNIKVVFYDNSAKNTLPETKNWTNSEGAYNSEKNILGINTGRLGERGDFGLIQRKFAHELTHSIQREEGFPVGGGLFTIFNEVKKLVGIDGAATVKTVIDAINNMDRSNLNKNQNRILDEGIKATMAIFYNDTEVLNRQYKHILGEVDAKLVEDVMRKIQDGEKITLSYNQYLQLFSEQDNIDLNNLFILNNGDIQFSLTPEIKKSTSLKIEVKEVNGRLVVEPLVNGTKAGALRMLPYEDGYRVDSVAVYDKYQNKRLGTRLYQEAIKFLLKSQTPLYSLKVRSENAKKIWDKFVEIGVAQKVGEDYIAPNKGGLDKNNEAAPSDVMQYANTTDEKLSKEETAEAIDLAVSLGVESSQEVVAILKDAFLENNSFVFDKKKMKKAGFNDYEITKILTDVNLQNQIKNNLAKLENTDFSAPLMDVQALPEIGIFGKQKVKPKVKTVNVKTVNEQGEVVDKVSDTKELLRKTYPDTLPNDMPQIASSLLKSSENVVNTHNELFYKTLNDLKDAALDLGVDLKDIENRVFPLENFKSFVNSLMNYYSNPSDAFAEVYDEFFENYEAEKATKPTMSTPYTEYELLDKFNLVRNGNEYVKVEDVEIEPSAERQAKIPQLEVEDFAVDFDKLEKLVYHKEQLGAEMKTLQKPLIEEINLREVKKNPYLKATSEGVKLVSEDPLTAQKAELYGYEPKVAEKQPKKIETDYSLVQDVLVTQLTSENKVRTPKGNFTKFMDDNNKSVFLLDGSKQSTVDLEGYLSKADNTPKIEAKKLYSKEEFENNFGCV